jgi:hypothetical protein
MCGRYERRGDKQKIAEAFHVKGGLDEVDFGEDLDCAPGSIQSVVWMNEEGERTLGLMRWGFKLPVHLLRILPDDAIQAILLGDPVAKPEEPRPMKGLFD